MRAAILSSAARHVDTLLLALLRDNAAGPGQSRAPAAIVGPLLSLAVSQTDRAPIELLTRTITVPAGQGGRYAPWQFAMLAGLLDARDHARSALISISTSPSRGSGRPPAAWLPTMRRPRPSASAPSSLIGYGARRNTKDRDLLDRSLAAPGLARPPASRRGRPGDHRRPQARRRASGRLEEILSRRSATRSSTRSSRRTTWTSSLLSSLEDGCVPPAEIDPARRQQLLTRRTDPLRARAEAVFAHQSQPRQAVVDAYRAALDDARETRPPARRSSRSCAPRATVSATKGSRSGPTSPA